MECLWQNCPKLVRDFTSDHSAAAQQTEEPKVLDVVQLQQPPQPRLVPFSELQPSEPQPGMYVAGQGTTFTRY